MRKTDVECECGAVYTRVEVSDMYDQPKVHQGDRYLIPKATLPICNWPIRQVVALSESREWSGGYDR
jgi:hypothetical protein